MNNLYFMNVFDKTKCDELYNLKSYNNIKCNIAKLIITY